MRAGNCYTVIIDKGVNNKFENRIIFLTHTGTGEFAQLRKRGPLLFNHCFIFIYLFYLFVSTDSIHAGTQTDLSITMSPPLYTLNT